MKPLKIYMCLFYENEKSIWDSHLTQTLCKMGHEVFVTRKVGLQKSWYFFNRKFWGPRQKERITENILKDVKERHREKGIDLFFCYLFPFQFTPRLFRELVSLSIPSVYFFCDNFAYKEVAKKYAPYVTLNWVPEKNAVQQFERSGSKFLYLPMAANPDINYPVAVEETVDVSFLGTKTPYRRHLLGQVLQSGLNFRVYGGGWCPNQKDFHPPKEDIQDSPAYPKPRFMERVASYMRFKKSALLRFMRYGLVPKLRCKWYARLGEEYETTLQTVANRRYLSHSEANEVYSFSSVSIGINDQFNPLLKDRFVFYTKLRDFEATIAGACHLTQATPEGPELFVDGREVMTYSTVEELIDKAKFLLKNEPFRKKLRVAARKRALAEHTWQHRFQRVFSELGLRR
ncbi:MAG: glycosyltransferase [Candidatus Omnitrophota bacterium]|nr:MAG: glycosyltransferase [Candidatus Omnitrophota bacterium]